MECIEYINNITSTAPAYIVLSLINPVQVDWPVWAPRTDAWNYALIGYSSVFSLFYFILGITSLALVIKRDCARLKTKTFFAIYVCLSVLGFSRGLHIALDPFGVQGWLMGFFPQWTIISRSLAVLGFPSLTASYTLVFLTLYRSTEMGSSRLWHQQWRVVIPLVLAHYTVAIVAEIIANTAIYPALIVIIICEAAFSTWGVVICFIFLFAGRRLLKKLKTQCESSNRISNSFFKTQRERNKHKRTRQESQSTLSEENYARNYQKISKTIRKVIIITYITALLAIIYAIFSKVSLFFASWLIFHDCLGFIGQGNPVIWLCIQIGIKIMELPLACIMLYSVTDMSGFVNMLCCCCKRRNTAKTETAKETQVRINLQSKSQISIGTQIETVSNSRSGTSSPEHIAPSSYTISIPALVHSSTNESINNLV